MSYIRFDGYDSMYIFTTMQAPLITELDAYLEKPVRIQ